MKDDLGRRLKQDYEDALRINLPRRSYVVIRIDGKGFHKFTAGLERPYCRRLADALDAAALHLCHEMIGCRFAYGQSDEYSFLLTDFEPGALEPQIPLLCELMKRVAYRVQIFYLMEQIAAPL